MMFNQSQSGFRHDTQSALSFKIYSANIRHFRCWFVTLRYFAFLNIEKAEQHISVDAVAGDLQGDFGSG
jgi:hypothetical protein